jgi:SSS family solute:Na+ symporter
VLIFLYFATVLGVGFAVPQVDPHQRRLLPLRPVDAGLGHRLAFVSANLGALEIIGMAANGAQYGLMTCTTTGSAPVPAMVFLGIVMMPFYYGSKVRSVRSSSGCGSTGPTHLINALSFAVAQVLIAGRQPVRPRADPDALLGWPLWVSILVGAAIVLTYIGIGGLSSAIYNEVLQFFVILAGLIPITVIGLVKVGGIDGLFDAVRDSKLGEAGLHTWANTGSTDNPLGASWIGIVFGLGFVLSFGYWTTNFAEVQRALSAKDMSAARRTPIIGAYPKLFIPLSP